jgi:hypothetical protein
MSCNDDDIKPVSNIDPFLTTQHPLPNQTDGLTTVTISAVPVPVPLASTYKPTAIQQQREAASNPAASVKPVSRNAKPPASQAGKGAPGQRKLPCPFCTGKIMAKSGGRLFASVGGFLQRNFNIRIPTALQSYLAENIPVTVKSALKGKCKVCGGKGTIPDPTDDSAKYQKAKSIAQSRAKEIQEKEALLAPPCGNRYTIIQGSDLLEVGIGMNDAPSYRVDKDKGVRNKGLIDPGLVNTKKAGPQFPEGATANHVQGLNPPASPGGHYVIKCSNKFSLLTGAQGIDITTGGPVTIHGGITQIIGPEVTVGSKTGRLLLEGDVVNINGKSVEITPNDGHLFVKGTISNSGNLMVGGHVHAESVSFTKAECSGRNEPTTISAPADLMTGPAFFGGLAAEALPSVIKDLVQNTVQNAAEPKFAQQLISQRGTLSMSEKMANLAYCAMPQELKPSGWLPIGTTFTAVIGGVTPSPTTVTLTTPAMLYNFPHTHALPDLRHTHEVRIPDLDCSADSAQEVRGKQAGVASSAPLHKQSTSGIGVLTGLFGAIGSVLAGTRSSTQNNLFSKKYGG